MDEILRRYKIEHPYCGADVGIGWYPIVESLISDLIAMGWNKELHQVKEKFGALRFYIGAGTQDIHNRIAEAEQASSTTCEDCGDRGTIERGNNWRACRCDSCRAKRVSGR